VDQVERGVMRSGQRLRIRFATVGASLPFEVISLAFPSEPLLVPYGDLLVTVPRLVWYGIQKRVHSLRKTSSRSENCFLFGLMSALDMSPPLTKHVLSTPKSCSHYVSEPWFWGKLGAESVKTAESRYRATKRLAYYGSCKPRV
jgi:hypothetical protein